MVLDTVPEHRRLRNPGNVPDVHGFGETMHIRAEIGIELDRASFAASVHEPRHGPALEPPCDCVAVAATDQDPRDLPHS
jgi:hypothetical protein